MQQPFAVNASRHADRTVIAIRGELDLATCDHLATALDDAMSDEPGAGVVVDLRELSFCDSSGLKVLLRAARGAPDRRVDLIMIRPPQPAWRVFEVSGLDTVLPFIDDADLDADAVARAS